MTFKQFQFNKHIQKAITDLNFVQPTEVQERVIPLITEGKDVIAAAQTGTGKTATFALPIVQKLFDKQEPSKKGKRIKALIIAPTRELALQIEKNIIAIAKYTELTTLTVFGGVDIDKQKSLLNQGVDLLVATPGRLLDLHKQQVLNLSKVEFLVLDEADLMLDMGFIYEVTKINNLCPTNKQTLLFSATIPEKVKDLANQILNEPEMVRIKPSALTAQNINQNLYLVPIKEKNKLLTYLFEHDLKPIVNAENGRIIIFRRTKYGVEKLEKLVIDQGYAVESIHGAKTQAARLDALKRFKRKDSNILIATDVASRGIDIEDVDVVINFDLPVSPEIYIHRVGRTARAGKEGMAISFCAAEEKEDLQRIQNLIRDVIPVVSNHPFELPADAKPQIHKKKSGSKYKKGRKSEASKKKKKRWY